jgi:hypothetical protein
VTDCHYELRQSLLESLPEDFPVDAFVAISVAWDIDIEGLSVPSIKSHASHVLDRACHNQLVKAETLGIPKHSLLCCGFQLAAQFKAGLSAVSSKSEVASGSLVASPAEVFLGIHDSLKLVLDEEINNWNQVMKELVFKSKVRRPSPEDLGFSSDDCKPLVTLEPYNAHRTLFCQSSDYATQDYLSNDFFCQLCHGEIPNSFLMCSGCLSLSNRDFIVCLDCSLKGHVLGDHEFPRDDQCNVILNPERHVGSRHHHTAHYYGPRVAGWVPHSCRVDDPSTQEGKPHQSTSRRKTKPPSRKKKNQKFLQLTCQDCDFCVLCSCVCHFHFSFVVRRWDLRALQGLSEDLETLRRTAEEVIAVPSLLGLHDSLLASNVLRDPRSNDAQFVIRLVTTNLHLHNISYNAMQDGPKSSSRHAQVACIICRVAPDLSPEGSKNSKSIFGCFACGFGYHVNCFNLHHIRSDGASDIQRTIDARLEEHFNKFPGSVAYEFSVTDPRACVASGRKRSNNAVKVLTTSAQAKKKSATVVL